MLDVSARIAYNNLTEAIKPGKRGDNPMTRKPYRKAYTVQGVGKFSHITKIRQYDFLLTETWVDTSEDRDVAATVKQAKAFLAERVAQLRAAGCVVEEIAE
jgi:hypothetical protein